VEECTYFWGVNTSWGINTAESKDLYIRKIIRLHNQQEESISTQEVIRDEVLTLNPLRTHPQCEVTTLGEDKNKNGKRIPETVRETQIIGKKARKLSKKKSKLEKLQGVKEKTS
jgi:hypothetical protein